MAVGFANIVVTKVAGASAITSLSHRTPARLLPMKVAAVKKTAHAALGSFGGGLLGGDHVHITAHVKTGAGLSLTTQAASKVYRVKPGGSEARQRLVAHVEEDAVLILSPDPVAPFAESAYNQVQRFELAPSGTLVAVDWFSAGRTSNGERWAFKRFFSRNEVFIGESFSSAACADETATAAPDADACNKIGAALVEAVNLDGDLAEMAFDWSGVQYNTAATVIVYGHRAEAVSRRLHAAGALATRRRSRTRRPLVHDAADALATEAEAARAVKPHGELFASACDVALPVDASPSPATAAFNAAPAFAALSPPRLTVARIVAEHTEDVLRLLHHCLAPIASETGVVPYAERIHARTVAAPAAAASATHTPAARGREGAARSASSLGGGERTLSVASAIAMLGQQQSDAPVPGPSVPMTPLQRLRLLQLCDATLPTGAHHATRASPTWPCEGGFAHSAGLEAAAQLNVLNGAERAHSLARFASVAAASSCQLLAPHARDAHVLLSDAIVQLRHAGERSADGSAGSEEIRDQLVRRWQHLNDSLQSQLIATPPASRASQQQGRALSRVASSWLEEICANADSGDVDTAARAYALAAISKCDGHIHGALVLGALGALLQLPPRSVTEALAYMSSRDLLSAAVRLNLIGPLAAVALQARVAVTAADVAARASTRPREEAATAAPMLECIHVSHDLLDHRIFQT